MKFLLDVNASGIVTQWLRELGHDVVQVADKDPRMKDDDILLWAVMEQRVVVTTDQDFEEIIWREGKRHYGILRFENLPRAERKSLLTDVLKHHAQALEDQAIVIASSRKIRIRRNPSNKGDRQDK
jgi:predicted nuclease of predicted toxin-antitoxin system